MVKEAFKRYLNSAWLPALAFGCVLGAWVLVEFLPSRPMGGVSNILVCLAVVTFLGILAATLWNLIQQRWLFALVNGVLFFASAFAAFVFLAAFMFSSLFGPSEDGFADNLKIPEGIPIAEPEYATREAAPARASEGTDEFQKSIREALAIPGGDDPQFIPALPALRKAATDHAKTFLDYIEASPDWHVFIEQGNRFASRRWSYNGEPRNTLHGYISDFDGDEKFQTRCLLCLDRKQWSRYKVQHAHEGIQPVIPQLEPGNGLHESNVMIECGGVWVELFEQSGTRERRVTKATILALEKEFTAFLKDPQQAVEKARARSRDLAVRLGSSNEPLRLLHGMQPGIYVAVFSLNPGEPGAIYLKAFEVTQGTPLSVDRLEGASKTRMTWSADPAERFGAKSGFTIYEGDWGKPYAARFEVWFKPDSGKPERKLAERIFKIEGWQR
jgi:hypothetical protein